MDDVAVLVEYGTADYDSEGNPIKTTRRTPVFCKINAVGRSEYYNAASEGLKPELTMTISHQIDYSGEKVVEYNGCLYDVIRTYWRGDEVELTLQPKTGTQSERSEGGSVS